MICTNSQEWAAAIWLYRENWCRPPRLEGTFSDRIRAGSTKALWEAAARFNVAWNLRKDPRYRDCVAQRVLQEAMPETPDDYRAATIDLAEHAYREAEKNGIRPQWAFSAMSKFLMLRFPDRGVVFDANASSALLVLNGTIAHNYPQIEDASKKRVEFERFYCRWAAIAQPIITMLRDEIFGDDPVAASRIVDKFLWLRGHEDSARWLREASIDGDKGIASQGREVFDAGVEAGLFCPEH